jgi:NodT family efflux transporter outer membrane factor (OMF) lipoprotein
MKFAKLIWMVSLPFFAACSIGPDFSRPQPPETYGSYTNRRPTGFGQPELGHWWNTFGDPDLNALLNVVQSQNLDLMIAVERIQEARALRCIAANQQPSGGPRAQTTYEQNSNNSNFVVNSGGGDFVLNRSWFDAAWEVDLFGRFARGVRAAEADLLASQADYQQLRQSLLAEVASNYVGLRARQRQLRVVRASLETQRNTLRIAERRLEAGQVSKLDVTQGKSLIYQTEANLPLIEQELRLFQHRLAILLGRTPGPNIITNDTGIIPIPKFGIDIGVPADLLRRRPDIRAAENRLMAQGERIGIAKAELYPQLSLIGTVGLAARVGATFLTSDSLDFQVGPSFQWNILNYRRIQGLVEAEWARWRQACLTYRTTVLAAIQETEDALVTCEKKYSRLETLSKSIEVDLDSRETAVELYGNGLLGFQRVLDTHRQLLRGMDAQVLEQEQLVQALIRVYKSAGGGWQQVNSLPQSRVFPGQEPPEKFLQSPRKSEVKADDEADASDDELEFGDDYLNDPSPSDKAARARSGKLKIMLSPSKPTPAHSFVPTAARTLPSPATEWISDVPVVQEGRASQGILIAKGIHISRHGPPNSRTIQFEPQRETRSGSPDLPNRSSTTTSQDSETEETSVRLLGPVTVSRTPQATKMELELKQWATKDSPSTPLPSVSPKLGVPTPIYR